MSLAVLYRVVEVRVSCADSILEDNRKICNRDALYCLDREDVMSWSGSLCNER